MSLDPCLSRLIGLIATGTTRLYSPKVHTNPRRLEKREIELDFLRGVAILMVLDFHSPDQILFFPFKLLGFEHFGWVGVDIFFVLSGFLVGGLLIKEWKVKGQIDSKQFLIRRGLKIWPQYYAFLLVLLITGHRPIKQLLGNLLNIQNYVGGVAHTWSLAVEEHAYLLLILCFAVAQRRKTRMRNLFLFLSATTALVVVTRLIQICMGYDVFAWTHTRIDGILYGVLLAILYHYAPETFRRMQHRWWLWLLLVGFALTFLRFANGHIPWKASVSWDCGNAIGAALLMLLYRHREGRSRPAAYRFVAWIGINSYGIYLWHASVVAPVKALAPRLPEWASRSWLAIAPITLGVLLGVATTAVIELPALKLRDKLFPRRVDSAVGVPAEIEEEMLKGQTIS